MLVWSNAHYVKTSVTLKPMVHIINGRAYTDKLYSIWHVIDENNNAYYYVDNTEVKQLDRWYTVECTRKRYRNQKIYILAIIIIFVLLIKK